MGKYVRKGVQVTCEVLLTELLHLLKKSPCGKGRLPHRRYDGSLGHGPQT